jgi:hypothetical protein
MPNNIKNRLKINGTNKQIKEVFERYNTRYEAEIQTAYDGTAICRNKSVDEFSVGWLDFKTGNFTTREADTTRTGLPDGWVIEVSQPRNHFPDFDKIKPHPVCDEYNDIPSQAVVRNHPNWWMTWNRLNWGTKWNSYCNSEQDYGIYIFETAWSGVPMLILEMSKQNPEIEFEYTYADEDSGYNVGKFIFKNGETLQMYKPNGGSKDAYDIYFELNPEDKQNYHLVNDKYEYLDEIE